MEKFSEIKYTRPNLEQIKDSISEKVKAFKEADDYAAARELYLEIQGININFETAYAIAYVRNTMDVSNNFYNEEMKFYGEAMADMQDVTKESMKALLESKFRPDFENEFGKHLFRLAEATFRTSVPENFDLLVKEDDLCNEYKKTTALCSCDFRGEKCNFYGLLKHMQSTDRNERKEAFEKWAALYESISDKLDEIYTELVKVRVKIAENAGFDSYVSYIYEQSGHFDYDPADIAEFREQVRLHIVPLCEKIYREQAERLGLERLKFYDTPLFYPDGNADPVGDRECLVNAASKMYHELSPETGEFFDFMTEHELFDLETKPNKHLGGYCIDLTSYKAPFIFSNFNGTNADIDVLTHEAGHAFQAYRSLRRRIVNEYTASTSDINEIHSTAMEFFTEKWMELFFAGDKEKADKYRKSHLSETFTSIPYIVSVDEFQHRVFADPDMTAADRRRLWKEIEEKYMPSRDYDGNAFLENGGYWMQKQHIFLYPFYYADYALAETCVFELYGKMNSDFDSAFKTYMKLCDLGGSKGYRELLHEAGLRSPFDKGTVENAAKSVEASLAKL